MPATNDQIAALAKEIANTLNILSDVTTANTEAHKVFAGLIGQTARLRADVAKLRTDILTLWVAVGLTFILAALDLLVVVVAL